MPVSRWDPNTELKTLDAQLSQVAEALARPKERLTQAVEAISGWSQAQHIDHLTLAMDLNFRAVRQLILGSEAETSLPEPSEPVPLHPMAERMFRSGKIPRGAAEAPERVVPQETSEIHIVQARVKELAQEARSLRVLSAQLLELPGAIPHPILGPFSANDWVRFASVHTAHHLSIVDEIEAALSP